MSKPRRPISLYAAYACLAFSAFTLGMQCVARAECPADKGSYWTITDGTVCHGDRLGR